MKLGEFCHEPKDCVSQHCLPMCNSKEQKKMCMEPEWVFKRHDLNVPSCADKSLVEDLKKYKKVPVSQLGETCHADSSCFSQQCIPECGENSDLWRCIESEAFYARHMKKRPICIDRHMALALTSTNNFQATRHIGVPCDTHDDCISRNCLPICENPRLGSLCVETKRSFDMINIPSPTCVEKKSSIELISNIRSINKRLETQKDRNKLQQGGSLQSLLRQYKGLQNSAKQDKSINRYDAILNEEVQHLIKVSKDKDQVLGQIKQVKEMYEAEKIRKQKLKEEMARKSRANPNFRQAEENRESLIKLNEVEESNVVDWAEEEKEILRLAEERENPNGIEGAQESLNGAEEDEIINWAEEEEEILRLSEVRERLRNEIDQEQISMNEGLTKLKLIENLRKVEEQEREMYTYQRYSKFLDLF